MQASKYFTTNLVQGQMETKRVVWRSNLPHHHTTIYTMRGTQEKKVNFNAIKLF